MLFLQFSALLAACWLAVLTDICIALEIKSFIAIICFSAGDKEILSEIVIWNSPPTYTHILPKNERFQAIKNCCSFLIEPTLRYFYYETFFKRKNFFLQLKRGENVLLLL